MYYLYIYENKINDKVYIGITNNMTKRTSQHRRKIVGPIDHAIKKYGEGNFTITIIKITDTLDKILQEEIYWISRMREFLGTKNVYNITDGGQGSCGRKASKETKLNLALVANGSF